MNQFVYLINNRTGCKVKCVNPAFQSKLNSLIVQLKKIFVQLKNNGRSTSLDNQLKKVLNQVYVLLIGNRNQSSVSIPRSGSQNGQTILKLLELLIIFLIYFDLKAGNYITGEQISIYINELKMTIKERINELKMTIKERIKELIQELMKELMI